MAAPILLTNPSQKTKAIVIVTLLVVFYLLFGFGLYTCGRSNDEPGFTKSARVAMTLIDLESDTTKPMSQADSIKRQTEFVKKFNDTATFLRFEMWLYKSVSGEVHDNIINPVIPYYNEYIKQKYIEFNKTKSN